MNLSTTNKAQGGGFTTALVLVIFYLIAPWFGIERPPVAELGGALIVVLTGIVGFVIGWVGVYFAPKNAPPAALFLLCLLLVGCASANLQTQLLLACQGYSDTEKALRPFKPRMTQAQVATMRRSIEVAEPICTGEGDLTDTRGALNVVRARLRELVIIQNEVQS